MHTLLQTLNGILYTFPLCSLAGMWSLGLTKIQYSVVFGLNLTWTLSFCKLLSLDWKGLGHKAAWWIVVSSTICPQVCLYADGGSRRGGADWWMNHLGSLVSYINALTINNIISGRWTGNVQSLYIYGPCNGKVMRTADMHEICTHGSYQYAAEMATRGCRSGSASTGGDNTSDNCS